MRAFLLLSACYLLAPQLLTNEEYEKLRCGLSTKVSRLVAEDGKGSLPDSVSRRDVTVLLAPSPGA
jgi:hypothetical protein